MTTQRPKHNQYKEIALEGPKLKHLYDNLEEEYELLDLLISTRQKTGETQAKVAKPMGTKTSAVYV